MTEEELRDKIIDTVAYNQGAYYASTIPTADDIMAIVMPLIREHIEDQGVIAAWRGRCERAEAEQDRQRVLLTEAANVLDEILHYSGGADHALEDEYVVDRASDVLTKIGGGA